MSIYYLSIGNSDDKLTQQEWFGFIDDIDIALNMGCVRIHGRWYSEPKSPWQNACWCIQPDSEEWIEKGLKPVLRLFASRYRQDSIALAKADTEFIEPS